MGVELLFAPVTILIFVIVNIGVVVLQRLLFRRAFDVLGMKKVIVGYAFVLALNLLLGAFLGGSSLREVMSNFLLACYVSLIFVSFGLLPLSLALARRGAVSAGAVIMAGASLAIVIGFAMMLPIGLDRIVERGMLEWVLRQTSILGFLVAVSSAFSIGLRVR